MSSEDVEIRRGKFMKVNKAWNILGNEETRKEYDAQWKQRSLAQDWPIQEEIHIDELEEDEDCFVHACRCGGEFVLQAIHVEMCVDYVQCDSCSLCVKILYGE